MNAFVLAQSIAYASPSFSDKSGMHKKQKAWDKFIDTLTWDKLIGKSTGKMMKDYTNVLHSLGVPVRHGLKKKKGDK